VIVTERAQDGLLRDLIHVRNSLQQLRHLLSSLQEASGLEDVEFDVDTEESCAELDDDMRDRVVDEFLQSNLSEWIIGHSHLVEKLLREMILRCTDSRNDDALTREGAPNLRYQNVLREQGCFELLMSLLEALIERKRLPLWILEEPEAAPVLKIGQLVYRLCKQVCKCNATNAAALSRWIPSMQQHLLTEMKCEDTLTEMRVSPPRRGIAHGLHGLHGLRAWCLPRHLSALWRTCTDRRHVVSCSPPRQPCSTEQAASYAHRCDGVSQVRRPLRAAQHRVERRDPHVPQAARQGEEAAADRLPRRPVRLPQTSAAPLSVSRCSHARRNLPPCRVVRVGPLPIVCCVWSCATVNDNDNTSRPPRARPFVRSRNT
jgi:hypothetical protein